MSYIAIRQDHTVVGWGQNSYGTVGNGAGSLYAWVRWPVKVPYLTHITAVAAGGQFVMARRSDGTVWSWGSNVYGQLGDGTRTSRYKPVRTAITGVRSIYAAEGTAYAVKSDGSVWRWGYRTATSHWVRPVRITGVPPALATGAGYVITTTHRLFHLRQLSGGGAYVPGLTNVKGVVGGVGFTEVLLSNGHVYGWGDDSVGQLGVVPSSSGFTQRSPAHVLITGVTAIAASNDFMLALTNNGSVFGWGENADNQLGCRCSLTHHPTPVRVGALTGVRAIATGESAGFAIK